VQKKTKIKLLFCVHERDEGKRSCAASGSNALRQYAKVQLEGVNIKIKKSGCLGLCKHGPVIQLLPEKLYFQCKTEAEIDMLCKKLINEADDDSCEALVINTGKSAKKGK